MFPQVTSMCPTPCRDCDKQMLVTLLFGASPVLGDVGEVKLDDPVQCLLQTKHLQTFQADKKSDIGPVPKESGLKRRQCQHHK